MVVGEHMQVHVVDVSTVENLAAENESFLTNFRLYYPNSVAGQRVKDFLLESAPDFTKHDLNLEPGKYFHPCTERSCSIFVRLRSPKAFQ